MGCFMVDIETLGTESTSVVLSAALIHFDFSPDDYRQKYGQDLVDVYTGFAQSACFVKFDAEEQKKKYSRTVDKDTLVWWNKQSQIARDYAMNPTASDLSVHDGFNKMRKYIDENGGSNQIFWCRGTLDQMALDSLAHAADIPPLARYNKWRDVRTAIDILADDAKDGYCSIPGFKSDLHVIKHIPQNDCANDILMLLYHK